MLLVDRVDGPEVIDEVVASQKSRAQAREHREVGRELPFHTTALGKVLLANMPPEDLERLLPKLRLQKRTRTSILSEQELRRQLAEVRKQGFATSQREHYVSVCALAVPLKDAAGVTRAALSLNGSPESAAWADQARVVALMKTAAREIARNFY